MDILETPEISEGRCCRHSNKGTNSPIKDPTYRTRNLPTFPCHRATRGATRNDDGADVAVDGETAMWIH